jgi:hypothetical protein
MSTSGFANDAIYFQLLANRSTNDVLRHDLHEVAERYRLIAPAPLSPSPKDPAHWTFRAEECRTLADQFHSHFCRDQLYRLAATYDALAGYARRQCLAHR